MIENTNDVCYFCYGTFNVWIMGALLMFDILYFIIFYYFMKIIDNI